MKKAFTTLLLGCSLFMCGLLPFDGAFHVAAAAEVDESKIDGLKCFIMVRKDVKGKRVRGKPEHLVSPEYLVIETLG